MCDYVHMETEMTVTMMTFRHSDVYECSQDPCRRVMSTCHVHY